jgi:hypothetical protein
VNRSRLEDVRRLIMGLIRLNNKPIVTPKDKITVRELKRLADISALERIYELDSGRVLVDTDVIDAENAEYGSTLDWQRGSGASH